MAILLARCEQHSAKKARVEEVGGPGDEKQNAGGCFLYLVPQPVRAPHLAFSFGKRPRSDVIHGQVGEKVLPHGGVGEKGRRTVTGGDAMARSEQKVTKKGCDLGTGAPEKNRSPQGKKAVRQGEGTGEVGRAEVQSSGLSKGSLGQGEGSECGGKRYLIAHQSFTGSSRSFWHLTLNRAEQIPWAH